MNFLARISVPRRLNLYRRFSVVASPEYNKRNYANNVTEYNTVIGSLIAQRRGYLLRDAYEDMILDGVQPIRDTFHSLIVGTMKGGRLEDAFYFRDQMKANGLPPDVNLYNFLISTCGKCKNSDAAIKVLEEMKIYGVKPKAETFICLLGACAATGRIDHVYSTYLIFKSTFAKNITWLFTFNNTVINSSGNKQNGRHLFYFLKIVSV